MSWSWHCQWQDKKQKAQKDKPNKRLARQVTPPFRSDQVILLQLMLPQGLLRVIILHSLWEICPTQLTKAEKTHFPSVSQVLFLLKFIDIFYYKTLILILVHLDYDEGSKAEEVLPKTMKAYYSPASQPFPRTTAEHREPFLTPLTSPELSSVHYLLVPNMCFMLFICPLAWNELPTFNNFYKIQFSHNAGMLHCI